jgi:glycosyltransferase involved in cell wall biosynthesis
MLSICLATYNGEKYLKEQLDSIFYQMQQGDELLIGDDGSMDGTKKIINEYSTYPIKIIYGQNIGIVDNFSNLIMCASNNCIVLCDQDDVWLPDRLTKIRIHLKYSQLVVTNGLVVDSRLNPTGQTVFEYVGFRKGFIKNLFKNSYVGCCIAFKKDILVGFLPFHSNIYAHDWLIGLLASLSGNISVVESPTILYRRHLNNYSNTGNKSKNNIITKIIIRAKLLCLIIFVKLKNIVDY